MNEKCPACEAGETASFRVEMRRCRACGLVWARNRIFAAAAYEEGRERDIYAGSKAGLFRGCLKTLAERFPGRGRLLDVGAAYGAFLGMARAEGWFPEGVEIDPKMSASALAAGFKVYDRPLEELGLPEASYDVVTAFEVLSQMDAPFKALAVMRRALKPGGLIYIREFNGAFHLALDGNRMFGALGLRPSVIHNFNFTAESLRRGLSAAGFSDIELRNSPPTSGDPYGTGGILGGSFTGSLKNLYYYLSRAVYIASFGRSFIGSALIVTARK